MTRKDARLFVPPRDETLREHFERLAREGVPSLERELAYAAKVAAAVLADDNAPAEAQRKAPRVQQLAARLAHYLATSKERHAINDAFILGARFTEMWLSWHCAEDVTVRRNLIRKRDARNQARAIPQELAVTVLNLDDELEARKPRKSDRASAIVTRLSKRWPALTTRMVRTIRENRLKYLGAQ